MQYKFSREQMNERIYYTNKEKGREKVQIDGWKEKNEQTTPEHLYSHPNG